GVATLAPPAPRVGMPAHPPRPALEVLLADGDWFYFAGIWRPASHDWPEAYAVVSIEANGDVAPYHDRQMAVLRRRQRMDWLDLSRPEHELLQPWPIGAV